MMPNINLNEVYVPKFDGNFANFPGFYDELLWTIEKNERYDNCQRLKLLKRAMVGKVENLLAEVGTDGELYTPTMCDLYNTYFNKRRIIAEYFATICGLPTIKNFELREGIDKVRCALRGLKVVVSMWKPYRRLWPLLWPEKFPKNCGMTGIRRIKIIVPINLSNHLQRS